MSLSENSDEFIEAIKSLNAKEIVRFLKDLNILNQKSSEEIFPLTAACQSNQTPVVDLILSCGADLEVINPENQTPLFESALNGNKEMTQLLVKLGANVNHQDSEGKTALMHSIINVHKDVISILIDAGTNLELEDKEGMTALMYSLKHLGLAQLESIFGNKPGLLKKLEEQKKILAEKIERENAEKKQTVKGESASIDSKVTKNQSQMPGSPQVNNANEIVSKEQDPSKIALEKDTTNIISGKKSVDGVTKKDADTTIIKNHQKDSMVNSVESTTPGRPKLEGEEKGILNSKMHTEKIEGASNIVSKSNYKEVDPSKGDSMKIKKIEKPPGAEGELSDAPDEVLEADDEDFEADNSFDKNEDFDEEKKSALNSPEKRSEFFGKVKTEFENFLKDNPKGDKTKPRPKPPEDKLSLAEFSKTISDVTEHLNEGIEPTLLKKSGKPLLGENEKNIRLKPSSGPEIKSDSMKLSSTPKTEIDIKGNKVINETTLNLSESEEAQVIAGSKDKLDIKSADKKVIPGQSSSPIVNESNASKTKSSGGAGVEVTPQKGPANKTVKSTTQKMVEDSMVVKSKKDNLEIEKKATVLSGSVKSNSDDNLDDVQRIKGSKEGDLNITDTMKIKSTPAAAQVSTVVKGSEVPLEVKTEIKSPTVDEATPKQAPTESKSATMNSKGEINIEVDETISRHKVNETNKKGQTHLMVSAGKGDIKGVQTVISLEGDTSLRDFNGFTALMFAAQGGYVECVRELSKFSGDLEVKSGKGFTALALAVMKDKADCVAALINAGANKDIQIKGETLLTLAVSKDALNAIKMLMTLGADPMEKNRKGRSPIEIAKKLRKKKLEAFFNKHMAAMVKK